jgi:hypothetical protein
MFPLDNVATARCLLHLATEFLRIQHRVGYHLKVTENVSIPYTLRGFDVATGPAVASCRWLESSRVVEKKHKKYL